MSISRALLVVAGSTAFSCGGNDSQVQANFASGFAPARHAVSVFGVFKDGQLSADAWEAIGPRISPALGARFCEPGYGAALQSTAAPVQSAIDEYARDNGMTDDLLAQLAPAAKGDLLVVITFAGHLPAPPKSDLAGSNDSSSAPVQGGGRGGAMGMGGSGRGGGGRGGPRGGPPPPSPVDTNELDVSASFYSVAERRSIGLVSIEYKGNSVQDALTRLSSRLARELPGATCAGWDWTAAKLDPDKVLHSGDHGEETR